MKIKNLAQVLIFIGSEHGLSLDPREDFMAFQDGEITTFKWLSQKLPCPTETEIQQASARFAAWQQKQQYASKRKLEYPSIEEQLDMMWHYIEKTRTDGADKGLFKTWFDTIKAVKDKYPKTK